MDPAPSAVGGVQLPASAAQGMMAPRRWYDLEMQSNESEYEEIVQPKRQKEQQGSPAQNDGVEENVQRNAREDARRESS